MTIHICRPDTIAVRRIMRCPTCERRRRFSGVEAFWYGALWTCLGCGDSFGDGERLERPFKRGWREESKKRARETWDQAVALRSLEHRAWVDRQFAAHLSHLNETPPAGATAEGAETTPNTT